MSLESIIKRITSLADARGEAIIQQARQEADRLLQQAEAQGQAFSQALLKKETAALDTQRQRFIVQARLEAKKALLKAKQELLDEVFAKVKQELARGKIKKEQIAVDTVREASADIDFFLGQIRLGVETEAAAILFEE